MLGDVVDAHVGHVDHAGHRGGVDDVRPATATLEPRHESGQPEELPFDVDPVDPAPDIQRRLVERTAAVGTCVVTENGNRPESLFGAVGRRGPLVRVGDIEGYRHHGAPGGCQFLLGLGEARFVDVRERHLRAGGDERPRHPKSHARRCAGDECCLSCWPFRCHCTTIAPSDIKVCQNLKLVSAATDHRGRRKNAAGLFGRRRRHTAIRADSCASRDRRGSRPTQPG